MTTTVQPRGLSPAYIPTIKQPRHVLRPARGASSAAAIRYACLMESFHEGLVSTLRIGMKTLGAISVLAGILLVPLLVRSERRSREEQQQRSQEALASLIAADLRQRGDFDAYRNARKKLLLGQYDRISMEFEQAMQAEPDLCRDFYWNNIDRSRFIRELLRRYPGTHYETLYERTHHHGGRKDQ